MRTPVLLLLLLLAVAGLALAAALLPSPRSSSAVSGATDVAAGQGHTCAVLKGGQVKCWGLNDSGQLGDGTTTNRTTPTDICADATCASPLTGVVAIAAGFGHTCALTTGGDVKCWGWNEFGQIGDGTSGDGDPNTLDNIRTTPVDVAGLPPGGATAVAAGLGHSCALVTGGGVKCWGLNNFGQLGDGTNTNRPTPVDVATLTGAAEIAVGFGHSCALVTGGGVTCWGDNFFGQLGDGTTTNSTTPSDVCADATCASPFTDAAGIDAGTAHSCAPTTGGGVKCWGSNEFGQLGDGTSGDGDPNTLDNINLTPVDVCADAPCDSALTSVVNIGTGGDHTCAVTGAGGVKCWGFNAFGQLGDGTSGEGNLSATPVDMCADPACTSLFGQLGAETSGAGAESGRIDACADVRCVSPLTAASGVAGLGGGGGHTITVTIAGKVFSTGKNDSGQLGNGTTTDITIPVFVQGLFLLGKPTATPTPTETPVPSPSPVPSPGPSPTPEEKCPQPKERGLAVRWKQPRRTLVSDVFGLDRVTQSFLIVIVPDAAGRCIVSHTEDARVETDLYYTAVVSEKTEIENRVGRGQCVKWSFRVHYRTILGAFTGQPGTEGFNVDIEFVGIGSTGTILTVLVFCADGSRGFFGLADRLGNETPLGSATPGPAAGLVENEASLLAADSGCPVSFQGVTPKEKVVDPAQVIDDIVATTVAPVGSNFVCTAVVTLAEALDSGLVTSSVIAEYRSFLSTVVAEGDQLVTVDWLRGDGLAFSTIAVTNAAGDEFKWDSMISSWAVPGPPPGPPAPPTVLGPDSDLDGDGCTDLQEFGDDENLGGQRNPLNFWDFFDPNRDLAVGLLDFLAVLRHFGTVSVPPPTKAEALAAKALPEPPIGDYWVLADRGGQAPGEDPWDELPPNGSIGLTDFLSVVRQFGHTCR